MYPFFGCHSVPGVEENCCANCLALPPPKGNCTFANDDLADKRGTVDVEYFIQGDLDQYSTRFYLKLTGEGLVAWCRIFNEMSTGQPETE